MRAIHFLVSFTLLFNSPFSFGAETSNGAKQTSSAATKKPASAEQSVQLKKGKCPTPLKEWVLDDYQDKSTLIVFKFNSEAKTCNTSVTAYQDYMNGKNIQTQFKTPDALSAELSKQYSSTISSSMKNTLDGCNDGAGLTPEQAKIAQTRFYAAATRIEKFNKAAVEEMAFIDSVSEGPGVLEGIECSAMLPDLKSQCQHLQNEGLKCKSNSAERFDEQVQKTMDNIAKIQALKEAETNCKSGSLVKCAGSTKDCPMRGGFTFTSQKTATKKCENIAVAIEVLKDEVPWIRGDVFDKIARGPAKPRSSVREYLSRDKIKEGLREQLKSNRTALASAYKDNLQNFRCLMYDTKDNGEKCDFEKTRTELAKLDAPVVPQLSDRRASMEFKTYFDAESCLLDRHEDRANTKGVVDSSARDAALTIATAGLGSIAAGAKVIGGLSRTAIATRRGAFAGALAVDGYFAQGSSREAFKSCTSKSAAILDNLSVKDRQKHMVCDSHNSNVSIARQTNSSCLVDALLAGADLLPFLGAAAPLLKMTKTLPSTGATTPPTGAVNPPNAPKVEAPKVADAPKAETAAAEKPKPKVKPKADKPSESAAPAPVADAKKADTSQSATKPVEETPTVTGDKTPTTPTETTIDPVTVTVQKTNADALTANESAASVLLAPNSTKVTTSQNAYLAELDKVQTARAADPVVDTALTANKIREVAAATGKAVANGASENLDNVGSLMRRDTNNGTRTANNVAAGIHEAQATLKRNPDIKIARADGETVPGNVTQIHNTSNGTEIEVAYTKADGSMGSRRLLANEFFQTNPKIRDALDDQFYTFMSGGLKRGQTDQVAATAQRKAQNFPTTKTVEQVADYTPTQAPLDLRNNNSNSAMAAIAPSAPPVQARSIQQVVAKPAQSVNLQPEVQNWGSAAPANNFQPSVNRAPASQEYSAPVQATKSAEEELVQALSQSNTGNAAPAVTFGKVKSDPAPTFRASGGGSNSGINAKADNRPTTYVDVTDNVRFVEGEKIKIPNFEGGAAAEFDVVKKLDNGLLRVKDSSGKEFDLLRDEVKSAERLNIGAASPNALSAMPAPAAAKAGANDIVEKIKLKEEFARAGDNITVKNFEGGGDLNASVVRKNTDGTVRVKDEAGKEFDLLKTEVKDAEFSRGLTAEVRQNLEIADEASRLKAAEDYLGRPLTDAQKDAVLASHKIAEDKGIYALNKTDLRQKTKTLRDAGLTEDEASLLLRKGVTGSTGIDNVKIVADQAPVPKFDIVKGKQLEVPMGNTGRTNPGAVRSGPDAKGYYEVEFYQKGAGIGTTRKTAAELTAANVKLPSKAENPIINVPAVGKDVSYPGKVISGPNAKGQYEVEIYPPGKPPTMVRLDGSELKKANTPEAVRQAKIREARRASFEKRSSAELEQILDDSLRQADSRGVRDRYNVSYDVGGQKVSDLKNKKIDIEGQRALEELAKRQNKPVNDLYEEVKQARQSIEPDSSSVRRIASEDAPVAGFSAPTANKKIIDPVEVAGDSRNKLDYLAEQDGLKGSRMNERQRESAARELGIYDADKTAALDYNTVASKKEARDLFDKLFPGQKDFDPEMLRQSMSFNPRGGYIGAREFTNAEKFVNAVKKADVDGSTLSLSERRLLNKFTDRAPLYARQVNPEAASITRQSLEAVVPPRITNNQVSAFAARGDEIVAQVKLKPEFVRAGDQVSVKNFEGGADLKATFVRKNAGGTIRVKDSQGKEFNLSPQTTAEAQFHRGLTAELKVNGSLDEPSRVKAAADYVKRPLTPGQKDAVLASHNVGGEGRSYFDYTAKELREKTEILRKAGFTAPEASLLLRKGITGNNPGEISNLIKVAPNEVRLGDDVIIREFNGTGELRGSITGPAKNGGLILREANGTETIIYKSDLDDLSNAQVTRNPTTRSIASAEPLPLERAAIVAPAPKKIVPVEASEVRVGDRVTLRDFNGEGELDAFIVETRKNGTYLVRKANGSEITLYKSDLEELGNVKITREWGAKPPPPKGEKASLVDNSPDSPILVSKDKKVNPDIAVPLGNGELRQGRVLSQLDVTPKTYVVEYVDEVGVTSQVHLTQDELLTVNTADNLKKVKAERERSVQYQAKSDTELQQVLDEGNRAAKEAVGKGRAVDKPDLSAEAQSALSEIARRNQVTSSAVFEAYRRAGPKGLKDLKTAQDIIRDGPLVGPRPEVPVAVKSLKEMKTGDYVVTAGVGDKVKLSNATEGIVIGRHKVNGEVEYTVAVKQADGMYRKSKLTDRELGDANSAFVAIRVEPSRSMDPAAISSRIEDDFKRAYNESDLTDLRRRSRTKIEARNNVKYDDERNPLLKSNAGVATPDGSIYININRDTDQRFSTLLHEVSHTKTDVKQGDLTLQSLNGHLKASGYKDKFSLDEIKAASINFAADKQTVIAQSKAGKPGIPNKAVKRDIESMQTSVDRRQGFITVSNAALDKVDESLGSLTMSKNSWGKNGEINTIWHLKLKNVEGHSEAPVYMQFLTPVNTSRAEAMAQIREFSKNERIKLLNAQSKLDYDKAYLTGLRVKVGVPKPDAPLNGPSIFRTVEAKGTTRNIASDVKAQAAKIENKATDQLVKELEGVIGNRGRATGLRSTDELTAGHPLTPVVEKQSQIVHRLNKIDPNLQPENFARVSSKVADDLLKSGDIDLARPYYKLSAETIETQLGTTAKSFWANEANTKAAIKSGFISGNDELAHMATQKSVLAKVKSANEAEVKRVALDQYHNLSYEYGKILYGIKRYGNKNKELDLLVIRKQQQHLAKKYGLTKQIDEVDGAGSFNKVDEQADLTVDDLVSNPKQIIDPDVHKKTKPRIPASTQAAPPSAALPVEKAIAKTEVSKSSPELEAQVDSYVKALKADDLAPKEAKSVLHQQDLIAATRNPVVATVMTKTGVNFQGLKFGMLDSDVGKIAKFQENLLLKPTVESNELFDNLRGVAKTPASLELEMILKQQGFAHPHVLNPKLTNQEIREIIAEVPVLRGYLHELPGMQLAIRDFNAGNISKEQFRERFLANLGHNGPNEGYWSFLSNNLVPNALAKAQHPKAKSLFEGTIYQSGKTANGVTIPVYPSPQSVEGVVHSVFDRLSQGTRGGVDKIFYELGGAKLAASPKAAIREIGMAPNTGLQLPHEMLVGNPEKTMLQLKALQKHAGTSPIFTKPQQGELSQFVGGAITRLEKQNQFIKENLDVVRDEKGVIQKMTLRFQNQKITITNDTPADEVAESMSKMLHHEENLHGEPFKEFVLPSAKPVLAKANLDQRHSQTSLDYLLVNIAKRSDNEKMDAPEVVEFLKTYKNDPAFATWLKSKEVPNAVHYDVKGNAVKLLTEYKGLERKPAAIKDSVTVNLADQKLQEPSRLNEWQAERQINFKRSQYDNVLSGLKKGDVVQAPSAQSGKVESIELGDYIGAGNTSNLYAMSDPGKVIRLPYLTTGVSGQKSGKDFFQTYVQTRDKYVGIPGLEVVKVYDHGKNFEYIVNERVPIKMTLNEVEEHLYVLKDNKAPTPAQMKEIAELQQTWDKFVKMAPEIAKRSNDQTRVSSLQSTRAVDRDMALVQEARQVALTPDGRFVLLDWE